MASGTLNNGRGFVDKRRGRVHSTVPLTEEANYGNVSAMRTRLTAISATKYPSWKLDAMTKNDMVNALRLETTDKNGI